MNQDRQQPASERSDPGSTAAAPNISPYISPPHTTEQPTNVRYFIIGVSVLMAFSLYLNRVCLGEIVKTDQFLNDVKLSKEEIGRILGAFFFTYALFQVPAGWVSDRFGARRMLAGYILVWSLLTGLTGLMSSSLGLLLARLIFGVAQAGAYPTSAAIVRRWVGANHRGRASSLVSFGGRSGGMAAPTLTALCVVYLGGWRQTLWLYGILGVAIAALYWWVVRERPSEHPRCNQAERDLIGRPVDDRPPELSEILPMLKACCLSTSLWLNSVAQFCVNVGWAFLITWLPTYHKESKGVDDSTGAIMVSIVLAQGMLGQLLGGVATDWSVKTFGLRRGRILPISSACMIAGVAYLSCLGIDSAWGVVACCAVVSLMTDVGNPSIWAFMQDVGGRNTAAIHGWANMWGNFGAALSSIMVPWLMKLGEGTAEQEGMGNGLVFMACGGAFFLAGFAALGMDATRPLTVRQRPMGTEKL